MIANFVFINENLFISVDDILLYLENSISEKNLENNIITAIYSLKQIKQQNGCKKS